LNKRQVLAAALGAIGLALVASNALGAGTPTRTASYIFDDDDRVRVSTDAAPWAAMALVRVNFAPFSGYCSGAFVTPSLLLTAGHCLYERGDGLARSVDVYPARDGETLPRGEAVGVTNIWVPDEWRRAADAGLVDTTVGADYGLVLLPAGAASPTSTFTLGADSDATLANPTLGPTVGGYPAVNADISHFTPWAATRPALLFVEPTSIGYDADATEGQSGGPVIAGGLLIGIHHGSVDTCYVGRLTRSCNIARRVDALLIQQIAAACRQLGGSPTACAAQSVIEPGALAPITNRRLIVPIAPRRARGW
jgi:V8-like Glu-specific endopeptidase